MEMTTLAEPKELHVHILGHDVSLIITEATSSDAAEWLDDYTIDISELGEIQAELCLRNLCGRFEAMSLKLYSVRDRQPVRYGGVWQVVPDYRQAARIMMWQYNYLPTEALTPESFKETFGNMLGAHFHDKWIYYDRSIEKMIGYFGRNLTAGQRFIDMIMRHVARYERRDTADTQSHIAGAGEKPSVHSAVSDTSERDIQPITQ